MAKQSAVMYAANKMAQHIIREQTPARLALGNDAALIAAHEVLGLGPGRAEAFQTAYYKALDDLAEMYVRDTTENHDNRLDYSKGTRDEVIRRIVGDKLFVPFDESYGAVYMDELKRIRAMRGAE